MPGRAENMGGGWETRRSRIPNNTEWIVIKLARSGLIRKIEVDTNHFKGNYPNECEIHACFGEFGPWKLLLNRTKLQGHTQHYFDKELNELGPVSHVKVTIFPDGGISRLRFHGEVYAVLPISETVIQNSLKQCVEGIPITREDFLRYGDVDLSNSNLPINNASGASVGVLWNTQFTNLVPDKPLQLSRIRSFTPTSFPYLVTELERHTVSSQTFIPINSGKYLVIVALPSKFGDHPDILNFKAFIVNSNQSITIKAGVWHHRLTPLENEYSDFMLAGWDGAANTGEVSRCSLQPCILSVSAPTK